MKKLLIIEDDVPFAATLARRMSKHGFSCEQVHQANKALHACLQQKPDCVLLDMKLVSDNGLMLIKPIRAALPKVRLVLLTGFASVTTAVQAMRLGADDYLAKPVSTQMLLTALDSPLTNPKQPHNVAALDIDTMSAERVEWEHINQVLSSNAGNVSATARQLGMHRRTLQRKLQKKPVSK
ncbi:MAG: response regulator [Colwellia polaris]|jgi:two-component system response regulator RegA|uniref:response regulator transcription factor n=1 Tax=Colwellia polaris TaxID=326537 RepID=UPI000A16E0D2|nr:response regulator [Colwellia polaris]|tara:strand:- start:6398 stop:6940 length:543 start_codon:yes stop_codon:yes gene_type:complete